MQLNELKAEIVRQGMTIGEFSEKIDMPRSRVSRRFDDPMMFTLDEIIKIKEALDLDNQRLVEIFF